VLLSHLRLIQVVERDNLPVRNNEAHINDDEAAVKLHMVLDEVVVDDFVFLFGHFNILRDFVAGPLFPFLDVNFFNFVRI